MSDISCSFQYPSKVQYISFYTVFSSFCYLQVHEVKPVEPLRGPSACLMTSTVFTTRWRSWETICLAPCRWLLRSTITHVILSLCEAHKTAAVRDRCRDSECIQKDLYLSGSSWFLCSFSQKWIWVSPLLTSPSSTMKRSPPCCWKPVRKTQRWSTAGWQIRPTIKSNFWLTPYHPVHSWCCSTLSPLVVSSL